MNTLILATGPAATAIAHPGPWGHPGSPGGPFFLLPLLWLLLVGAVVFVLIRRSRRGVAPWSRGVAGATDAAERILAERFARGDIDDAEYRLRLEVLRGTGEAS